MTAARMQPVVSPDLPAPWTTPQILRASLAAVFVSCLLVMLAALWGARSHRQAIRTVGREAAPAIIAAQHIEAALADMDANAADEMLQPGGATQLDKRREEAADAIIGAAGNPVFGDAERKAVRTLAAGVSVYSAEVQEARDLRTVSGKRALDAYRRAMEYMDSTLLPAAAQLDRAGREAIDRAYGARKGASARALFLLIASGLMLGFALFALQVFLARRMRRILNPLIALATLTGFIFVSYAARSFVNAGHDLSVAKEDAFESMRAFWLTRSVASAAESDESRYLLDPEHSGADERAFTGKTDRIARLPETAPRAEILRDLSEGPNSAKRVNGFTGYLADELANVSFAGEREAAVDALASYLDYLDTDKRIRKLEQSGQHQAAVALYAGTAQGQSRWAFNRFDAALGRGIEIDRRAFDQAVEDGFRDVSGFEITAPLAAAAIAGLTALGLRQRLREYSL
ncbi:MAG TPA: hypothetical protein VHB50_13405 [Bryobacteraceae bacterium]|nr:hypothetical protein [Bryobacteraceae bacterium]